MKIKNDIKMYNCSLCRESDEKTFEEARQGYLVTICKNCSKKEFPSGASTIEKNEKGKIERIDFLTKLLSL